MENLTLDRLGRGRTGANDKSVELGQTAKQLSRCRINKLLWAGAWMLAALYLLSCAGGCSIAAKKDISRIEAKHGVNIDITTAGAVADLAGGNSLVTLWNVEKELQQFPYEAKKGMNIHIGAGFDILAEAKTLGEIFSAPLIGAATQDHPGKHQGDVYVLNKDLWGTYMDLQQPGTIMWQDPHLRHELMHAYEIRALKEILFVGKWQQLLDERLGERDEMTHKLAFIDSISLVSSKSEITTKRFRPYIDFCSRWMASMYGDLNKDGLVGEEDKRILSVRLSDFDADGDGKISYADAAVFSGLKHSNTSGINPITQIEMTAGVLGYRPKGFASPYGRSRPWEDKAEVLSFCIRERILPAIYRKAPAKDVSRAYRQLEAIRKQDPVFGRKIEIMGLLFGNLEAAENRNDRFVQDYGHLLVSPEADSNNESVTIIIN